MQKRTQDFDAVTLLQSTVPEASASFEEALALEKRRVRMGRSHGKKKGSKDERKKEGKKEGRRNLVSVKG